MVFREFISNPYKNKNGYLYLRVSEYKRDKRTLKRKTTTRQGDGSGRENRNKWTKKIDIYCGKIFEINSQPKFITFQDFIEKKSQNYLDYKLNSKFEDIVYDFAKYLLFIYDLDEEDFFHGRKKVYALNEKLLSRETLKWIIDFEINPIKKQENELERFAIRCESTGVFDYDIIQTLFMKMMPELEQEDIKTLQEEIEEFEKLKPKTQKFDNFRDFIGKTQ